MEKRVIDGVELRRSSGNVYADLGLPDAEKLKIKTGLDRDQGGDAPPALDAARRRQAHGHHPPKVSDMMRGDFSNVSERTLMGSPKRPGYDIEIKVRPVSRRPGRLTLAVA